MTRPPAFDRLIRTTALRYARHGRFARHFASGKLGGDPAFAFLLATGQLAGATRVLDLGCGQGLLAALLVEARAMHAQGDWPQGWPAPPEAHVHGIELMPADVERARSAVPAESATFVEGDIAATPFPDADAVVILDVLHYLPYDAQERVLDAVRTALEKRGPLLLRIGDADGGLGFRISNWVDAVVFRVRGHRRPRLYCRSLRDWVKLLEDQGYAVETRSLSEGTPFANILLIAHPSPSRA